MKSQFFIFAVAFVCLVNAQSPLPVQWQKCYGGSLNDILQMAEPDTGGGSVLSGYTNSSDGDVSTNNGSDDGWLGRTDADGNLLFAKTLGGSLGDFFFDAKPTADGGLIATGYSQSNNGDVSGNHGDYDIWVVKLDAAGTLQWQKCLGGTAYESARSVIETSDGNFLIAGLTLSNNGDVSGKHDGQDAWIVKLNSTGSVVWQKCLGGSKTEAANDIIETGAGNYLMVGYTNSNNGDVTGNHKPNFNDLWVVELNTAGAIQWQKCYGGNQDEVATSVEILSDGNYIISGYTGGVFGSTPPVYNSGDVSGHNGNVDVWVIKISVTGSLLWQNALGGLAYDYGNDITELTDGSLTVVGNTNSNDGDVSGNHHAAFAGQYDGWIANLSSTGTMQWQKCFGGSENNNIKAVVAKPSGTFDIVCSNAIADGDITCSIGLQDFFIARFGCEPVYYADADGDGYGDAAVSSVVCPPLPGYVVNSDDCDDDNASSYPGAIELCGNSIDDNCNGTVDENTLDATIAAIPNDTVCLHDGLLSAGYNADRSYQWYKNGILSPGYTSFSRYPSGTGTYKVLVTDLITGCSAFSNEIYMVVNPLPVISFSTPNGFDLCTTDTVIITTPYVAGYTYKWYKKGVLQAETSNIFKTTKKGSYTVTVTNSFGCVKYSSALKVFKSCRLAETNALEEEDIVLYPNPAADKIYVAIETAEIYEGQVQLMITNTLGETVYTQATAISGGALNTAIDINELPNGVYMLHLSYSGNRTVKEFIVQK